MLEVAGHLHRDETGETRNPNQALALHEKVHQDPKCWEVAQLILSSPPVGD